MASQAIYQATTKVAIDEPEFVVPSNSQVYLLKKSTPSCMLASYPPACCVRESESQPDALCVCCCCCRVRNSCPRAYVCVCICDGALDPPSLALFSGFDLVCRVPRASRTHTRARPQRHVRVRSLARSLAMPARWRARAEIWRRTSEQCRSKNS